MLAIIEGEEAGRELSVTGATLIGRGPDVDVVIDDSEMSGRHASFAPAGDGLTVEDLSSTNGTFVNGQRVTDAVALNGGDRVELGTSVIEVRLGAPAAAPAVAPAAAAPAAAGVPDLARNSIEAEALVKDFGDHSAVDGVS